MKIIRRRKPSLKTALGVTKAKRSFARTAGIPTSKAGRKKKAYNKLTGGAYGKYQRTRAKVDRPFKYHKNPHSCLGFLLSIITAVIVLVGLIVWFLL